MNIQLFIFLALQQNNGTQQLIFLKTVFKKGVTKNMLLRKKNLALLPENVNLIGQSW